MQEDTLINKNNLLDQQFIPTDLFQTDQNTNNFHNYKDPSLKPTISLKVMPYFLAMQSEALKFGHHIILDSGYRSYLYQQVIWDKNVLEKGLEETKKYVALPGSSEHQSGIAFDIACLRGNPLEYDDSVKEQDPETKWMFENAHKYGFILRYPKNKENITGYNFEPWHYRFVGINLATIIKENNITLEEYHINKEKYYTKVNQPTKKNFLTILDFFMAYYYVFKNLENNSDIFYIIEEYLNYYPQTKYINTPNYYIENLIAGVKLLSKEQIENFIDDNLVDFIKNT